MMMRFAFAGRVSTEDQQDPEASRAWQLARARALTERHGEIVAEFFDIGQSRSIPWKRRPQASRLLEGILKLGYQSPVRARRRDMVMIMARVTMASWWVGRVS